MKASYNWLKEFVDLDLSPKDLAHTLTMSGLEVEAIEEVEEDTVFDIGITPNRPDCLSIRGLAREISAILKIPFSDASIKIGSTRRESPDITIVDESLCSRYVSRLVKGVRPAASPDWLARRLEAHGIRSTSNIVDITNYVLLEYGQPLHAFDLDKLSGKKIVVKTAGAVNAFMTLDGEKRTLNKDMLLIWDSEKPVALAGVMGGQNTEVSESTENILLESAYFKPESIRRTSKYLNLSTESSYRFERGVDINGVRTALDRAAMLITEVSGGNISELSDIYPNPHVRKKIFVSFEKINSIIGTHISESFVEKTIKDLGFEIKRKAGTTQSGEQGIEVTPPSFRNDVEMDVDIVEEVARIYGYDKIPSTMPVIQMSTAGKNSSQGTIKSIRNAMSISGYSEVINYSFLNPEDLDKLNLSVQDRRREVVAIRNPLRKEEEAMRSTLVPSLLNNVRLNLSRGEKMLRFFELSRVFLPPEEEKLPKESFQLGAVYHKDMATSIWQDRHDSFYDLKGALENLFAELKIRDYSFVHENDLLEPYLHPGKSCSIMVEGKRSGSLGVLHPGVSEAFDIQGNMSILELFDLDDLRQAVQSSIKFVSLPRYPYVERDIAVLVSSDVTISETKKTMLGIGSDIIESVRLFDIYTGKPIPSDKKSLAFSIRYRSSEKTLTDGEVDAVHSQIIKRLEKDLKAELRS